MKTLSEKIMDFRSDSMWTTYAINVEDIKQFIKDLKDVFDVGFSEEIMMSNRFIDKELDRLAGKELIG